MHVAKHGEVANFECQFCDSAFLLPKEYQQHLKLKHNKAIDKFDIMANEKLLKTDRTRPGVDKVKPKGWFKYSLQID